jgi:hypothetical protein
MAAAAAAASPKAASEGRNPNFAAVRDTVRIRACGPLRKVLA